MHLAYLMELDCKAISEVIRTFRQLKENSIKSPHGDFPFESPNLLPMEVMKTNKENLHETSWLFVSAIHLLLESSFGDSGKVTFSVRLPHCLEKIGLKNQTAQSIVNWYSMNGGPKNMERQTKMAVLPPLHFLVNMTSSFPSKGNWRRLLLYWPGIVILV